MVYSGQYKTDAAAGYQDYKCGCYPGATLKVPAQPVVRLFEAGGCGAGRKFVLGGTHYTLYLRA